MALVSMKEMLKKAKAGHYAVGQFNLNNLQWAQAILQAAEEEQAPVIVAASDRLVDFLGGFQTITSMVNSLLIEMKITVPVALHLDHGMTIDRCKQAIDAGFTSVMIDGSHSPIEDNIAMTKEVVAYAQPRNVSVEAEVGTVGGMEDGLIGGVKYADLDECVRVVEEANIDALAAALGSVHGPYQGEPKLGFEEMKVISERTGVPLVLHGGSGIPDYQIRKAILLGHAKINVNTECLQAWAHAVRTILTNDQDIYDYRAITTPGTEAIVETVKTKMREFQTSGKAKERV
ncbi:class II fructose-1,6-bisphosphate aldolase [Halalkalibacterium halodurans]|uniref:6-phospho-5-dehydro-2-deoxy-D-gluconate aldolase n=1 Tax=Halalkalibacterium halodurans (strain ATCC BAA-125 / DSM 18197 / FERM 7344 / JCM 9153 / C-125) TaxID=272558 RepID=IOLJ_HALH5|nr:class II fructose-1,6-bisphosphate aldolase [Halalkalibacterium halodurans]Q9KAH3.1 RecName: Full=6-phospho-5-dehydro-2-deoxy-D-gluconate aldolase; Short=DKGP aldolase [Halalkalibacterium halodurans C-125]MED4126169.1 class II fructose-1,6-bisphosphate aldolase [Halalkalibacterium halodurans]MED4171347.1 class II fructose-1,6-bisphosphate aldolase [Halalkalibacterium halodurans]BAB06033.1 fructose bisphosphate aldolase [Halalkalibacterium halodurans C-125]